METSLLSEQADILCKETQVTGLRAGLGCQATKLVPLDMERGARI